MVHPCIVCIPIDLMQQLWQIVQQFTGQNYVCYVEHVYGLFQFAVEFPAVLLNTTTGELESEFQQYVMPDEHPILSDFCTELTGISQVR